MVRGLLQGPRHEWPDELSPVLAASQLEGQVEHAHNSLDISVHTPLVYIDPLRASSVFAPPPEDSSVFLTYDARAPVL